ncbi:hypothetical protein RDWZM_000416 [Blomia tropicalis]|uniref:Uncharacterized protein n=1 Tax=Blomia tropicalis TaxID=40697 RepID=A0A9Q0RPL8_BLOTA|nr:hypothetical protein RDWZM_000416 [Blomia tropicalis]
MFKKTTIDPEDLEQVMKVLAKLCSSNVWSNVQLADFTARRFEMGYVNNIFCCEMTEEAHERLINKYSSSAEDNLSKIVIKFTPKDFFIKFKRYEMIAYHTILSERGVLPKLIYFDDDCMINEYIESRTYSYEDDCDSQTVQQLAKTLAIVHSARPPISMNGFELFNKFFDDNEENENNPMISDTINKKYLDLLMKESEEIRNKYYSTFSEIDYKKINNFNKLLLDKIKSPLVFSHCDFNRGNRLVQREPKTGKSRVYLIDFDYSCFFYRGFDLGRYFSNYRHREDMFGDEGFPTDDEMKLFLEAYRNECGRLQGDQYLLNENNSLERLIIESKVFTLMAYSDYFFCLMMYTNNPTGPKKDYFLESAYNRYNAIKKQRKLFTADGTLPMLLDNHDYQL